MSNCNYNLADSGPVAIDAGRHPILESLQNDFVVCYCYNCCLHYSTFFRYTDYAWY